MQVSAIMERTEPTIAAENMANRLADRVRNIWLEKKNAGVKAWEENFFEDADGIKFLEKESFPNLVGIDYIFRWWGDGRDEDGLAGELDVLWKAEVNSSMYIYKTWIRFADRDFIIGITPNEDRKRDINREAFRDAFAQWQKLYVNEIKAVTE